MSLQRLGNHNNFSMQQRGNTIVWLLLQHDGSNKACTKRWTHRWIEVHFGKKIHPLWAIWCLDAPTKHWLQALAPCPLCPWMMASHTQNDADDVVPSPSRVATVQAKVRQPRAMCLDECQVRRSAYSVRKLWFGSNFPIGKTLRKLVK